LSTGRRGDDHDLVALGEAVQLDRSWFSVLSFSPE